MPNTYEERAIAALRAKSYRITMPRVLVIRALANAATAQSAYDLHDAIQSSGGKIDVVSVYRTLATLVECGLVYRVGMLDGDYVRREISPNYRVPVLAVDKAARSVTEVEPDGRIAAVAIGFATGIRKRMVSGQLEIEVTSL